MGKEKKDEGPENYGVTSGRFTQASTTTRLGKTITVCFSGLEVVISVREKCHGGVITNDIKIFDDDLDDLIFLIERIKPKIKEILADRGKIKDG